MPVPLVDPWRTRLVGVHGVPVPAGAVRRSGERRAGTRLVARRGQSGSAADRGVRRAPGSLTARGNGSRRLAGCPAGSQVGAGAHQRRQTRRGHVLHLVQLVVFIDGGLACVQGDRHRVPVRRVDALGDRVQASLVSAGRGALAQANGAGSGGRSSTVRTACVTCSAGRPSEVERPPSQVRTTGRPYVYATP